MKVGIDVNLISVHSQLNHNEFAMDGALVGFGLVGFNGVQNNKFKHKTKHTCIKTIGDQHYQLAPNLYYRHNLNDGLWCWCYNVLFVSVLDLIKMKNQISSLVYAKGKKEIFH